VRECIFVQQKYWYEDDSSKDYAVCGPSVNKAGNEDIDIG